MTERRSLKVEIRAPEDTPGQFEAVVVRYDVVDTYNTRFRAGCFGDSLEQRLPRICWGHDPMEPIGRYVDYRDTKTELTLMGQLDDFEAVPRARQAYSQLRSGTLDQFSVGFVRTAPAQRQPEGWSDIVKADLMEASPLIIASVPGTSLVSVRSVAGSATSVSLEVITALAQKVSRGEISQHEADIALRLVGGETLTTDDGGKVAEEQPDPAELAAAILGDDPAAIDVLERWS